MAIAYEADTTLPPLHPGEVLREDFLIPLGLSAGAIARACHVPRTRIERIAAEQIGISTDTALRLGRYLGTRADFWLNLQRQFELETRSRTLGPEIERIAPLASAEAA
ncbi:HigA family addiction module antidote protein [Methylobacterium mesophilicum SR1.6/6]|uniref:HigA family addiction module antidote protein n=1 Tax=Methylobacterium mesophilicum SR1.6/6 TaxID=908290 RepID=A0A6B9FPW2_9HYPH|nr:HigA family addiction module antitoxin [Methylobacterium mesophilicum]QGY04427.1 HigA family addiction module antidote protein [Methylobacterium mesophilicum SR1.6/6]